MNTMNRSPLTGLTLCTAAALLLFSVPRLNSQFAPPAPQTPEQALLAIKAANIALLEKQQATLTRLDALDKEAQQLRIFTKRN